MSEAKDILEGQPPPDGTPVDAVVLPFPRRAGAPEPQLSDHELRRLRQLLINFDAIAQTCPIAKRAILPE